MLVPKLLKSFPGDTQPTESSPVGRSSSPQLPTSSEPMGQGWFSCISQDPTVSSIISPPPFPVLTTLCPKPLIWRGGRLQHSGQIPLPTCPEREQPLRQLPPVRHARGRISVCHGAQTCSCWMHREPSAIDLLADSRRLCLHSAGRPCCRDTAPARGHLHSRGLPLRATELHGGLGLHRQSSRQSPAEAQGRGSGQWDGARTKILPKGGCCDLSGQCNALYCQGARDAKQRCRRLPVKPLKFVWGSPSQAISPETPWAVRTCPHKDLAVQVRGEAADTKAQQLCPGCCMTVCQKQIRTLLGDVCEQSHFQRTTLTSPYFCPRHKSPLFQLNSWC